jgi:hypothetical protein
MFGTCLSGRAHVHRGTRQVQTEPLPIIGSELAARSSAISNLMTLDPSVEELRGEKIPTYPLRFSTPELKPIPVGCRSRSRRPRRRSVNCCGNSLLQDGQPRNTGCVAPDATGTVTWVSQPSHVIRTCVILLALIYDSGKALPAGGIKPIIRLPPFPS